MSRYAEGTTVSVEQSRGDISGILAKHGVTRMGWSTGPEGDELLAEINERRYRFAIVRPTLVEIRRMFPNARDDNAKLQAEWRRRWRAIVLLLKAKLEFAGEGDVTTIEREFMPYLLVDGKRTLADVVEANQLQLVAGAK